MIELRGYVDEEGNQRFADWLDVLDAVAAAKATIAIACTEKANFSKVKGVGAGVFEYKIDFGPGLLHLLWQGRRTPPDPDRWGTT